MRLPIVLLLAVLLAACHARGAGNHENVGQNAPSLKEFADAGYDLKQPWPVTFSALVDGEKDADGLASELAGQGYDVEYGPQHGGIWEVYATKAFVPSLAAVDATEREVVAISDRYDGYYQGWYFEEAEDEGGDEEVAEGGE